MEIVDKKDMKKFKLKRNKSSNWKRISIRIEKGFQLELKQDFFRLVGEEFSQLAL